MKQTYQKPSLANSLFLPLASLVMVAGRFNIPLLRQVSGFLFLILTAVIIMWYMWYNIPLSSLIKAGFILTEVQKDTVAMQGDINEQD